MTTIDCVDTAGQDLLAFRLSNIWKLFPGQGCDEAALKGIGLEIKSGSSVSIVGRSGSGKSTLLNVMCALTRASKGSLTIAGRDFHGKAVNDSEAVWLRRRTGYISQASDLLGNFSVMENVRIAASCRSLALTDAEILHYLELVELTGKANDKPSELSGGQRQRVNIARALACKPIAIFADEPTGALDVYNARQIIDLLIKLTRDETHTTLLMVTHWPEAAAQCERQLCMLDGAIKYDRVGLSEDDIDGFIRTGKL